jgi:hypothetical protein
VLLLGKYLDTILALIITIISVRSQFIIKWIRKERKEESGERRKRERERRRRKEVRKEKGSGKEGRRQEGRTEGEHRE